ncbi:hypothetical protein [Roseateles sp.]|uniref:hypothetical protein n=1 Tax=Roseateles sp. TaxID=1971397 RepID=UPI002F3F1294
MGIPDTMLPHEVTVVRPATTTDTYGSQVRDYGGAATRTAGVRAWLQQDRRAEPREDGRDPLEQAWLMLTNHADVQGLDRIEWTGPTFEVEGPPEPAYTPAGFHHTEATLRVVTG